MSLTNLQKSILYGHLLGDGSIDSGRYNRFSFGQKEANKEWVEYTYNILSPFTDGRIMSRRVEKKSGIEFKKKEYYSYKFRTCCDDLFSTERERWYKNNKPHSQKMLPKDLLLDWDMIATWYADDGCNWQQGKWINLCSQSFTKKDNLFLMSELKRLGIVSTLNSRKDLWLIRIASESYYKFIDEVKPLLQNIKCMFYKIDTEIALKRRNYDEVTHSNKTKEQAKKMRKQGLTNVEIAKKLKVYRKTISRWLGNKNKSNVKLVSKHAEAFKLWETGLYTKIDIARELGVHAKTISKWITPK